MLCNYGSTLAGHSLTAVICTPLTPKSNSLSDASFISLQSNADRYRVMNPIIARGLDVNPHASELYASWPNQRASLSNILGEILPNGLMNFHSTTDLSPSLVLVIVAWAYQWSLNCNVEKVRLQVRLLHIIGAD